MEWHIFDKCVRTVFDPELFPGPDYIYNRPDLYTDDYETYLIICGRQKYEAEVTFKGEEARPAVRLMPLPDRALSLLAKAVLRDHPEIKKVIFEQTYGRVGEVRDTNHFRVIFPSTADELMERLHRHERKNLRRRFKQLNEDYGETHFVEYEGDAIPQQLVETFFRFKKASHNRDYPMSAAEYLSFYHVTNAYALMLGERVIAVRFTCEQCEIVNAENFSYDQEFAHYSAGLQIYNYTLCRLVEKGKKEIFLGGGTNAQKYLYGSIEEQTHTCIVKRRGA